MTGSSEAYTTPIGVAALLSSPEILTELKTDASIVHSRFRRTWLIEESDLVSMGWIFLADHPHHLKESRARRGLAVRNHLRGQVQKLLVHENDVNYEQHFYQEGDDG